MLIAQQASDAKADMLVEHGDTISLGSTRIGYGLTRIGYGLTRIGYGLTHIGYGLTHMLIARQGVTPRKIC
jgi:hypothetical protein